MRPSRRLTCWGLLLGFVPAVSLGQVKTDGSLGARQTLAGPNFSIPNTLGRQFGPNLFHSFSDFNVRAGESATFSGPNTVTNVLARVTGGGKSAINGALRSDIPSANLYLINPAGVVFGPGAQLDVSGSFAVTTADIVHLRGGGRFAASTNANASVLTTAPPAAFGFLRPTRPAGVSFNSSGLAVSQGKVLSVVAGDVRISPGVLGAEAGRINLVAAAPSSTVTLDPSSLEAPLTQDAASGRGRVQVGPDALVVTAGDGGSKISINAGRLDVVQSQIRTSINGDQPGIGMDVDVGALRIVNGQMFSTAEAGAGRGGDIRVNAGSVLIQSTDASLVIGIGADTTPLSTGNGGDVTISTGELTMLGPGATIISGAVGRGDSGNVVITARRFLLDGQAAGGTMGVFSRTTFQDPDAGDAGDITVTARELILRSDAVIGTFSFSPGNSGTINIDAARMLIDGTSSEATGMASNAA